MELTTEILIKNGFTTNHPEMVLPKYYIHGTNPEFRIQVELVYKTNSNVLGFDISCWKCDDTGAIIKRSSVGTTTTAEDLQRVIDLCEINKEIVLFK